MCERVRERENEREGGRVGQFVGGREGGRERVCGFVCEGEREREHRHSQVVLYNDVPTLSRCLCMHTTYACIQRMHAYTLRTFAHIHAPSFSLSQVIYSNEITDAFMTQVKSILFDRHNKHTKPRQIYVAVEQVEILKKQPFPSISYGYPSG